MLTVSIQFGLQDVTEHLDIITACTIALAHRGINIATLLIKLVTSAKFWQELVVIITRFAVEH